jgi:hypothetical protein
MTIDWLDEYINESRYLTVTSLETLYGTREFRLNVHEPLVNLFNIFRDVRSSVDDVSRAAITLFNRLIISSYRRFMTYDDRTSLDENFQKCLVNKAFDIEALPTQRELLYTLTSGSSLIQILRTMLMYIDADIQRLTTTSMPTTNQCTQRYARETLCPICASHSTTTDVTKKNISTNESLCPTACRYILRTCFNQTSNPYVAFASIAKGYSSVTKDIEQAAKELKVSDVENRQECELFSRFIVCCLQLVERLSKLHIYLYDMVVNATNTRQTYTQMQTACPHVNAKPFSPILSLSPIANQRREFVSNWNRSLHILFEQLHTSVDNLNLRLTQNVLTDICSNTNYAVQSKSCTQIDQTTNT